MYAVVARRYWINYHTNKANSTRVEFLYKSTLDWRKVLDIMCEEFPIEENWFVSVRAIPKGIVPPTYGV